MNRAAGISEKNVAVPTLQTLPASLIAKIFSHLTFSEITKLRGVSVKMERFARQHLNTTFLELGPRLVKRYTEYQMSLKNIDTGRCVSSDVLFRGNYLRLLCSEHAILLALCGNHVTKEEGCFSPGQILDLFVELQPTTATTDIAHEENTKLARLLLLIDRYLNWFEEFRLDFDKDNSWYGTCIVDFLDSYLNSSYNLLAEHEGSAVTLSGSYLIKGQSEIPPRVADPLGSPITKKELLDILQYIRKHVRWSNFVESFRNESKETTQLEECSEHVTTTYKHHHGHQRSYTKNQYNPSNSNGNPESLNVMVTLYCDRGCSPARLRGGFEEMNDWQKEIDLLKRDMKERKSVLERKLSGLSVNDTIYGEMLPRIRDIRRRCSTEGNKKPTHGKYNFNLEIKSIYPSVNASSGEKFGETMLNVCQTSEHIFAAQTECGLY